MSPGVPEEVKEFIFSTPGFATSNALLKYVCLFVNNFSGIQYSNEENAHRHAVCPGIRTNLYPF